MKDILAFVLTASTLILSAIASAKKKAQKRGDAKPFPVPSEPQSETVAEYVERNRRMDEDLQMEESLENDIVEEARGQSEPAEMTEEIGDIISQTAGNEAAGEKPLSFNPEEMIIYSEIMAPKYDNI